MVFEKVKKPCSDVLVIYYILKTKQKLTSDNSLIFERIKDMFTGACEIILTKNLPKNQQNIFLGNNSLAFRTQAFYSENLFL